MIDVGTRLGPYEIVGLLGSGGMGYVFRSRDTRLDREVAIKVLPQSMAEDPGALARFRREAKAVAAISHPNILSLFDLGSEQGFVYLVTELLEGRTLRTLMDGGPVAWRHACGIAAAVAEGLAAAHAKGVVHRDVKPENVFLGDDGRIKILDFGLAHSERFLAEAEKAGDTSGRTMPGTVLGSVGYMSPEQVRAERIEPTSDLFSLGCVLYEMLTGRRPFQRGSAIQTLAAILDEEPSAMPPALALPYELEQVLAHCLAKDPGERFQSARDLAFTLRAIAHTASVDGLMVPARSSSPALTAQHAFAPQHPYATPSGARSGSGSAGTSTVLTAPETHYAKSGDVNIAYQVVGSGAIDLVFVMGWITHLEYFWREPSFARFLRRLASFSRLILFDKRGTGLSDRVPLDQLPSLEQRMDDVRAVMEAVGSRRAALCGISEGGPMCSLFAATYPEKTTALVMIGTYAKRIQDPDYPWAPTAEQRQRFFELMQREWGGPVGIAERAPSRADDPAFREWWATYLRMGASPGAAVALTRMNAEVDIRPVLPTIRVPALVIHRSGDLCLKVEEGRYVAGKIPGARYVELPGADHLPFVGDQDAILDEVEEFLTGVRHGSEPDRLLATVLALRLVPPSADTEALLRQRRALQRELEWFRGREVELQGERLVASFDGPARAVRCAAAMQRVLSRAGIETAAGLHTGECDVIGDSLGGLPLELGAEVAARAGSGEILVSSTVRDLVAGSGITFDERGLAGLGAHGEWRLYRVVAA